ncbi:hypothetical protein [Kaarinaea lacus]
MEQDFRHFAELWETKGSALLDEGLQYIQQFDEIPIADGIFGDYVSRLLCLPFKEQHIPNICSLIDKQSPYLQEAGIKLAIACIRDVENHRQMSKAICKILKRKNLDPWVLLAIVKFARETAHPIRFPPLVCLYKGLAQWAFELEPIKRKPFSGNIMRNMGINPVREAQDVLDQIMINRYSKPSIIKAILPYLERQYDTRGAEVTTKAIRTKLGI